MRSKLVLPVLVTLSVLATGVFPDKITAQAVDSSTCQIFFASDRDNGGNWLTDVYVTSCDGANVRRLTTNMAPASAPELSPDGAKVLFYSSVSGNEEIYTLDLATNSITNLTNTPYSEYTPTWSPDGSQIAYGVYRDGNFDVYVMDAQGNNLRRLTTHPQADWMPAWSPDGTKIAFQSNRDGDYEIFVMDTEGGNVVQLTANSAVDSQPSWSPDGTKIAFTSLRDGGVYDNFIMNADGSNQVNITNTPAGWEIRPRWSADGQWIVFHGIPKEGDPNWEISQIRPDGTDRTNITTHPLVDVYPTFNNYQPVSSPASFSLTPLETAPSLTTVDKQLLLFSLEPLVQFPQPCPGGAGPGGILAANYPAEKLSQEQRQWLFEVFGNSGIAPVGYGGEGCGSSYDNADDNFKAMVCTSGQTGPGGIVPGAYNPAELTQEQRQWLFEIFGNTGTAPVGYGGPSCPNQQSNYTVDDVHIARVCSSPVFGPYGMRPGAYNPTELNQDERQWLWDVFGESPGGTAPVGYGGKFCPTQTANFPPPDRSLPYDPNPSSHFPSCTSRSPLKLGDIVALSSSTAVHQHPRHSSATSFTLTLGEQVTVVSGPSCEDDAIWWTIGTSDGRGGFMTEAPLLPGSPAADPVTYQLVPAPLPSASTSTNEVSFSEPAFLLTEDPAANPSAQCPSREACKEVFSTMIHFQLDAMGLVPGVGAIADAVNALVFSLEGNTSAAGLSAMAIIPVEGDLINAARLGIKIVPAPGGTKVQNLPQAGRLGQIRHASIEKEMTKTLGEAGILTEKRVYFKNGKYGKYDLVDLVNKVAYEIKPSSWLNSESKINQAATRLTEYIEALEQKYPGVKFTGLLQFYDN